MRSCRARGKWRSPPMPSGARQAWRCRRPRRTAAPQVTSWPVSRVLCDGLRRLTTIPLGRPLPDASRNLPGRLARKPAGAYAPRRPYSVLLPVGFTVPIPLPGSRWALAPPFHPCPPSYRKPLRACRAGARQHEGGRFAFCGTFPGVTPAGRYPAPCFHGARTFLPGGLSTLAGAAVQPAGSREIGVSGAPRQGLAGNPAIRRSSVAMVDRSAIPSTRSGRKWR